MRRRRFLQSSGMLAAAPSGAEAAAQGAAAQLRLEFQRSLGPLRIDRMALGQGGLSADPMWDGRLQEIRALQPAMIRLFVQEYFDLLPAANRYHFDTLDRSVDLIRATGAEPLLAICFKPRLLFPQIDQDIVEPTDYAQWEELIYRTVRHYIDRGTPVKYWEVANEPDIGEDGGCPYRFKPDNYVRYYERTVATVRRADPSARVGGPALANVRSPILPALLEACAAGRAPLDFISWHIYSSSPTQIRGTVDYAKSLLARHPSLKPETILNEWNMALLDPPTDVRFQPCFVAETVWQMKEAGLDWSSYYHIRDYHVDRERFAQFMTPNGAAFMARWWNRMPQYDGLFDYQNTIRPAYFTFKLLSRLTGDRRAAVSNQASVHAFLTWDDTYQLFNVLFWNFTVEPVTVDVAWEDLPQSMRVRRILLDAETASNDEIRRLRPIERRVLEAGKGSIRTTLDPYGIQFWSLEKP